MKSLILIFLISVPIQFAFASPQSLVDSSKKDLASLQKKETLLWVSLGGGVLGPYIGGDFKTTYAWGERSIEMKVIGASELAIFNPPSNEIIEYGLYYGMQKYNDLFLGRIAAGPSYFSGKRNGIGDIHNFGIGAEAEVMLKYEFAGLSIMFTTMVCPKFFYAGVILNVNAGKLN